MKYTAKRNLSLGLSVTFLVLALIVFFVWDWPSFKEVGELNKKINQEQTQYNNQYQAVQIAKSIIDQYKSLINVSQTVSLSIPRDPEIQNLLAQVDNITTQSGLTLDNINFETAATVVPSAKQAKQSTSIVQNYHTMTLTLGLSGNYESLKTWLNVIETNIRLMNVVKISFAGLSAEASKNIGIFNFKVALNVYYQ